MGRLILVKPYGYCVRPPVDWEAEKAHADLKYAYEHYDKLITPNEDVSASVF
tara:strand:+ start:3225 stop:3380 length:156 start_codon:yes stop_codon:yes gene_type:complete